MELLEPLYRLSVLRELLAKYDLKPTKGLGQNFLIDKNTVDRIVSAADLTRGDVVLEIGPGLGVLTQALLNEGVHVVAIEKDAKLAVALADIFRDQPAFTLIHQDALKVDFAACVCEVDAERGPKGPLKLVSNLPYYVTTPLLMHVLESPLTLERIVVMIQREVAARMMASPGTKEYGALSVAVNFHADLASVGTVPPTVFYPSPSVSSQVVSMSPRPCPFAVGREELFFQIVRAAFGKRRKTLLNALGDLPFTAAVLRAALDDAGIDPRRRGETLSLAEFAKLSLTLSSL